jgi:hypothetical protein
VLLAEAHDVEALLLGANTFIDDLQVALFQRVPSEHDALV